MGSVKSLSITVRPQEQTKLMVGDEVIEVTVTRHKGSKSSEINFKCTEKVKIKGPHILRKELKEKL